MIICLGPVGSGKTLLLKRLQNTETIDDTTTAVPTVGTNIFNFIINEKNYTVRELGGSMAPLWSMYFNHVDKVIYVVDASNLCQISAAGVLLYTVLANPMLQKAKVCTINIKYSLYYIISNRKRNHSDKCHLQTNFLNCLYGDFISFSEHLRRVMSFNDWYSKSKRSIVAKRNFVKLSPTLLNQKQNNKKFPFRVLINRTNLKHTDINSW